MKTIIEIIEDHQEDYQNMKTIPEITAEHAKELAKKFHDRIDHDEFHKIMTAITDRALVGFRSIGLNKISLPVKEKLTAKPFLFFIVNTQDDHTQERYVEVSW